MHIDCLLYTSELQGFGEYTYGRWYTIKGQHPSDETGTYRYKFDAPKSWAGQRVKIFFDGVMTDAEIMINGKPAGEMHQGGFYRFNYDITELLNLGKKNQLEVKVAKESANRSINAAERKADWWLFGGIYRPVDVYKRQVPRCHYILSSASRHLHVRKRQRVLLWEVFRQNCKILRVKQNAGLGAIRSPDGS